MKIVSVVGARPQFIKCAALSRKIRIEHEEILVHTGQHYDPEMSANFFEELEIPKPDYYLGVGSGSHGNQTGKMLVEIEKVLLKEAPDLVIVYGDTNSTLAGSLASSKLCIKVAHVEAGLRSFEKTMPEEINRIVVDHVSDLLFCPTASAVKNLQNEGIVSNVYNVGDVMKDALEYYRDISSEKSSILNQLRLNAKKFIVATIHRPINTDYIQNLSSIVDALCHSGELIILPLHPRTKKYLMKFDLWDKLRENVMVIPPIGYLDMINLISNSKKVIVDSGGIQKEAYMLRIPCITLRNTTEWGDTVEDGLNILVGADYDMIIDAIKNFNGSSLTGDIFGKGNACEKICNLLKNI